MEERLLKKATIRPNPTDIDLQQIIAHMLQDCAEKVDEVQVKAEEEFRNERIREILHGLRRIDNEYEGKETKLKRETLVFESKMKNLSRIKILQTKYEHVEDVFEKARLRLSNKDLSTHSTPYKEILKALIIEGLCKLMEPNVIVTGRKSDKVLVRSVLSEAKVSYETVTGLPVELKLNEGKYLNLSSEGGVLLSSPDYTVTLDNTLASRLEMVGYYILPEINILLFGEKKPDVVVRRPSYLPDIFDLENPGLQEQNKGLISLTGLTIGAVSIDESSSEVIHTKRPK